MAGDVPPISSVDPTPGPWQQIAGVIMVLSQEFWWAQWLEGAEHLVWEWLEHPETAPAEARVRLPLLRRLADEGGHWVRWDDRQGSVVPVHLDRWHHRHAKWLADLSVPHEGPA